MDVAYVFSAVYPEVTGGVQKRIYEVGTRLVADGHEVTLFGRHVWNGPREHERNGLKLRAVAPARNLYTEDDRRSIPEALGFSLRVLPSLRGHLDEHDLVVVSPFMPVLATKLGTLGTGTPVAVTWHEVWLEYWEEYIGALAPAGKLAERLAANVSHHPVAVSGLTADRLSQIGPDRCDIDVVHNGIDVQRVEQAPLPDAREGQQGYDVLFAGRLIADKRVDVLLEAFDTVAEGYDATLGVVGDGPAADSLRAQARQLDCADRVTFLGFLDDHDEVLGQMRAASVFASPSTREGFGLTYVEAMAADCAVIGADHPESAASEVIGDAGFLPSPTVDGVVEALDRALAGERPATEPTERARAFDWDEIAARTEEVYRRALEMR